MKLDDSTEQKIDDAVRRVSRGDASAFEVIVRQFEKPLRAWLAAHAPPGADVDELAQQSFIAAYTNLKQFSLGTSFGAWLFSIAKYQLRTETTRLRRLADYHSRYAPTLLQESLEKSTNENTELWDTRLDFLQDCVQQLGQNLGQYITWRYHDQISIEEMANATGRSTGAIKKQLWMLRQKLLKCIEHKTESLGGLS
jgi:RNA polymerase sigma-70 factor, ECF subfamily